jgi:hypothetical protein
MVQGWIRTDIEYKGDCGGAGYLTLPELGRNQAAALARARGISAR